MARNTYKWLKRSKRKFATSQQAWEDIEKHTRYTRQSVKVNHTRYFWRWKAGGLNPYRS